MSLCYSPIHSDEEDDDDNAAYESTGVPLPQPSILSTNSPFVLRPDPYAPDLASLFRPNDDTPVCVVQHPYSSLNTKITHASVVEDDDESEPTYLFLGYDSGFDPDSKNARHSQTYNADAILAWDCCTGKVIDSLAIPGASCMYVRASSSGMVAATTIYERVKARRRGVFFRPLTTIYVYVYADQRYHQLKSIAPRGYRSSPVAVVADSTCARFMVILTKNGRLLHQHLLGPSISTEVTALKDGPGPDGAELALLTDDMTGILLERSRPRIVVFIAEARHGVEVLQQVDLRKVMEASGQNFSRLLSSGALLPHFGGEGFAVLWKNNYVYFDMYSDIEGIKRARPKSRTIASLKRPSGIDIIAAVPTTVHWLALQLSDDRLLWRWWSPGETLIKEEPETTERAVKEEPAAGEVQMAVVKAEPLSGPMDSNGEEEEEEPDYDGALRDDEKGVEVISLSDSVDDGYDSDIEIIGSVAVVDLDAVEGGVAVEAPWGGTAMYNEDENGVVLLDDDLEDDRAATSDLLSTVNAATDQGAATRADPINAATLELPPDARTRYAPGKSIEFSPLSVSTSASTADEHARELWERAKADEAMASDEIEAQDWAAVHWPDVFEQNLKRRRKCVDRLISDIETNWSSTLCLRPRIPRY
ncbi:hypothetical protein Pmar_PMAR012693 [Perkinsus marinus ATCC 50983]|uniref:Uncharacterized protein n=1 Tax=Perkinsus marinus (strain ATCC 50983 / TXsc) TaxID=423536 RepID=C5K820_PERM5|nr:hypothetical protein Pmar_PMAR012693 [Perkinsus marinus ATCC 50983]EER19705.1 hypothetical protein Pmar_PMAR012693 [Perkinsus marinus ATCC 50983]|eukprot:XP_002787909.1 hypothetical protein Pmar_PMAR012693 [Perkinsus marinus ATCC 50983]